MNLQKNYLYNLVSLLLNNYIYLRFNEEPYFISISDIINHNVEITNVLERTRSFIEGERSLDIVLKRGIAINKFASPKYYIDINPIYFNKLRDEANNNSNS